MFVSVLSGSTLGDITKGALREYYPLSVALFYSRTVFVLVPVLVYAILKIIILVFLFFSSIIYVNRLTFLSVYVILKRFIL